ncbi:ABC transporter substrate-binding protein/permease [Microlunatus capsulatus]|uniref:Cystine transport system permease protein n=1 Tax=Microlunatus capsulatus TaxID=99117 RepID=A0ABS4Z6A7_9ACTN|nr:ABC transporter substrate-binding protein/permease [Microlunatus capsulatus]MBP2416581.1 cystine transport system permease protein [Microlunatus capsulatus]
MRRTTARLVALLAVLWLAAACSAGAPRSTLDEVRDSGVLRVGTEGTYTPFSYHDPTTGALTGYDVEVITAVAGKLGAEPEFVEAPFDALFASLVSDRFDVVANQVTRNPEREAQYALSQGYTYSQGVIITRADDDSITGLADLRGKTTAQSSTSNWAGVAEEAGAEVEAVEGFTQAVTLVKQQRVDATVNDNLAALEYFTTTGDTAVKVAAETGDTSEQVLAMRQDDTELRDAVNGALADLSADGTLASISDRYFGEDVSTGTADAAQPSQQPVVTQTTWELVKASAGPMALAAVKATIPLTVISFVVGLAIALVVALMRLSSVPVLAQVARVYISLIRGTPLLVQLFLIFYGLPGLGLTFNPFTAAVIAFSLNVGGYAAEVIRSAILSVPRGQWEAASTIGMGYTTTLRRVILPQAARTAVPPLSNTLISLVKDTSLASVVLVTELLRVAQVAAAPTFQFFALYGVAALYYWLICLVLSFGQQRLEHRLERGVSR